jgi:hypothetical protein
MTRRWQALQVGGFNALSILSLIGKTPLRAPGASPMMVATFHTTLVPHHHIG